MSNQHVDHERNRSKQDLSAPLFDVRCGRETQTPERAAEALEAIKRTEQCMQAAERMARRFRREGA